MNADEADLLDWIKRHAATLTRFTVDGYEARLVDSALGDGKVWRVATPARVRLKGDFATEAEARAAIAEHQAVWA